MTRYFNLLIILCVSYFTFCAKPLEPNNPYASDYEGNYELTVTPPEYDTLLTEASYTFRYTTGADTFESVNVIYPDSGMVKVEPVKRGKMYLTFKAEFTGNIVFSGERPNGKTVLDSVYVEVIFNDTTYPAPGVCFNDTLYEISRGDSATLIAVDSNGTAELYIWQFGLMEPETTTVGNITRFFGSSDTLAAYVSGLDRYGRSSKDTSEIRVLPFDYTVTLKTQDTIKVNESVSFTCAMSEDMFQRFTPAGGKYYWKIVAGANKIDTSGAGLTTISWTPEDSSLFYVSVYVKDTLGNRSPKVQKTVIIRLYKPEVSFDADTVFARTGVETSFSVTAFDTDSLGEIDSLYFDLDGKGNYETVTKDTVVSTVYYTGGTKRIRVYAKDKEGIKSLVDTLIVKVNSDKPYFTPGTPDTTVFKDSSLVLRVNPHTGESGVKIDSCFWEVNGVTTVSVSDTLEMTFSKAGVDTIVVNCKDADGIMSEFGDTIIVSVSLGRPIVESVVTGTTAWAYEMINCTVNGVDSNGTVSKWSVLWGDADTVDTSNTGKFSHLYTQSGEFTIKSYVEDNDGYVSDTFSFTIRIKDSKPKVDTIRTDSAVYIKDTAVFIVKGIDPNENLDSIGATFNDGTSVAGFIVPVIGDSAVFWYAFVNQGVNSVKFTVKDSTGQSSDSTIAVSVLLGEPVVNSLACDSANIWVNDINRYSVSASDPNGYIKKLYVNWNGGAVYNDSIILGDNFKEIDTAFYHAFDTTGGVKNVNVWAADEDGVVSNVKSAAFTVKRGEPTMWGDTNDTLWVIVNDVYKKYPVQVNALDPNGRIVKYYFGSGEVIAYADSNATGSFEFAVNLNTIHKGTPHYAWVKDDDGYLVGPQKFVVFADSVPEKIGASAVPLDLNPTTKYNISWSGMDKRDSLNTEYRVLIKKGSEIIDGDINTKEYIALDWTKAESAITYDENDEVTPFSWTYIADKGVGVYYYQVIARDARGSMSKCNVQFFKIQ